MTLSKEQLGILQHSLGVDHYGQGVGGRNHFVTDQDSPAGYVCESLCAYGLMKRDPRFPNELSGGGDVYHVTENGRRIMFSQCPKPPKKTPGQLRYEEWLALDGCTGETFGQWLKNRKKRTQWTVN